MSRYEMNKLLREITREDTARESFLRDPASFLKDRDLTGEERKALTARDCRKLYALGVHSFLLYGFVMRIFPGDPKEVEEEYCRTIASLGRIDYST